MLLLKPGDETLKPGMLRLLGRELAMFAREVKVVDEFHAQFLDGLS